MSDEPDEVAIQAAVSEAEIYVGWIDGGKRPFDKILYLDTPRMSRALLALHARCEALGADKAFQLQRAEAAEARVAVLEGLLSRTSNGLWKAATRLKSFYQDTSKLDEFRAEILAALTPAAEKQDGA